MPYSDSFESVLDAARAGAEWAWARLIDDIGGTLHGYVRRLGATDPDDLVSETWLHVVRGLPRFTGDEAAFRSWVFTIAHHRIIDERRRLRRKPTVSLDEKPRDEMTLEAGPSAESEALRTLSEQDLLMTLAALPATQREVLVLRFFVGFGITEIGSIIGKTPGATGAVQRRALKRLQKNLREDGRLRPPSSVTGVR